MASQEFGPVHNGQATCRSPLGLDLNSTLVCINHLEVLLRSILVKSKELDGHKRIKYYKIMYNYMEFICKII